MFTLGKNCQARANPYSKNVSTVARPGNLWCGFLQSAQGTSAPQQILAHSFPFHRVQSLLDISNLWLDYLITLWGFKPDRTRKNSSSSFADADFLEQVAIVTGLLCQGLSTTRKARQSSKRWSKPIIGNLNLTHQCLHVKIQLFIHAVWSRKKSKTSLYECDCKSPFPAHKGFPKA